MRVGCPIRRSRDQRSLASPPGLSQRATPFIASQCQGIHQMPLLRSFPDTARAISYKTRHSQGQKPPPQCDASREDTLPLRRTNSSQHSALILSNLVRDCRRISCQPRTETSASVTLSSPCQRTLPPAKASGNLVLPRSLFTSAHPNLTHRERQARGGGERDRTDDLLLAKQALSQLSYTPR